MSVSAFCLGASMLVFLANLVWSLDRPCASPAAANPWRARWLEWQVPTPVPVAQLRPDPDRSLGDPYEYGVPNAPPVADLAPPAIPVVA